MSRWAARLVLAVLIIIAVVALPGSSQGTVYVVPVEGTIEPGLASFISRALAQAEKEMAEAVLLEVNTFGGRVDAAVEIRDRIQQSEVPVMAFVNNRAWSAGALITLACSRIAIAPSGSIGAAEPRPNDEKTISALRAEFEATASSGGRDINIAAAMVDKSIAIEGLSEEGEILTLTAEEAVEFGMADLVAGSAEEALENWGLPTETVRLTPAFAERIVRFLTEPTVSSILLTIGFAGLLFEVVTAGWGVGGSVGLASLALFFGARIIAGLAGWEVVVLFFLGLLLLVLEVLVIPGFGLAGLGGLAAVFASIAMSFSSARSAAYSILGALLIGGAVVAFLSRFFEKSRAWDRLVLKTSQVREQGYVATRDLGQYVGREGVAITTLRPSGTILIDDDRLDAVTEGGFIPVNSKVRVVMVEGNRVVVRSVSENQLQ